MQELNFYTALNLIRQNDKPFSIVFIKYSETKKEGGQIRMLADVKTGPLKKTKNKNYMIAFIDANHKINNIYIHSIIQYIDEKNNHYKLVLK